MNGGYLVVVWSSTVASSNFLTLALSTGTGTKPALVTKGWGRAGVCLDPKAS